MLGLGLGLNKGGNLLSNLKLLTRNSDWAIWGDKATGTSKGTNSPAVNPIVDLVGTADGTLTGFAFTSASGYVDVVAPNGKTVTGIQGDGVNDVILLPSNAPNPVGTQDFGFAFVFKTRALTSTQALISRSIDLTIADVQYAVLIFADGQMLLRIGGVDLVIAVSGTILPNTFYKLVIHRKSGVLKALLLNVLKYNQANTTVLVSKPNTRLFARSNSIDGSINTSFSNSLLCYADYNNGDNIDAWEVDQNKAIAKIYGL